MDAQTSGEEELFTVTPYVAPDSILLAAGLIFTVVFVSQWPVLRQIARMDLAKAAKERAHG
jgi:ABC-type antimicrobial peptide transport system permease subunit